MMTELSHGGESNRPGCAGPDVHRYSGRCPGPWKLSIGPRCRLWLIVISGLLLSCLNAQAQFEPPLFPPSGDDPAAPLVEDLFRHLPKNPLTQASASRAISAIQAGDVTSGLEALQEILDQDSDFFISEPGSPPHSLFDGLEEVIRSHRDEYERLFGPTATQMLNQALAEQNLQQLEDVVRRFSMTDAGAKGLAELSRIDRDRGDPSRAARLLEQLARHPVTSNPMPMLRQAAELLLASGQVTQARSMLKQYPDLFSSARDRRQFEEMAAGSQISSPTDARIYEWWTPYGSPQQAGQAAPAPVLFDDAWRSDVIDDLHDFPALMLAPDVASHLASEHRKLMEAIEQQVRARSDRVAMPAARPIIVDHLVLTSGPGTVKAFNLFTGELEWNGVDVDETFDYLAKQSYSAGEAHDPVREEIRELFTAVRGWRDLTSSSISTDGRSVYAISNCQLVGTTSPQRMIQNTQRHSLLPQRTNRLTAYDLSTDGKKLWAVGSLGEDGPIEGLSDGREIYFFGAPLPVNGHLYAVGEELGQIQVFELDPATGNVLWSLALANPTRNLVLDDARRLAGLMPAYSDGLLICPTGHGGITAVDPLKRRVVWTHQYTEADPPMQRQVMMLRLMRPQNQNASQSREELLNDQRWFDSRLMIANDTIVFTPPDHDALVCLDLQTGLPRWPRAVPRQQLVYAATIFGQQLILVGRSEITALSLLDGSPVWASPIPIPPPSGRGVRLGDIFLQPLMTAEIGVVDLNTGRLVTRLPMESQRIPGNLVASDGVVVMQHSNGLVGFVSRSTLEERIAEQIRANADSPEALSMRGMWRLQQGELEEGLADLKATPSSQLPTSARIVLGWTLLEGLRTDFPSYRNQAETIERLISLPQQRQLFLRTYARGLQQAGETREAFSRYLELLKSISGPEPLIDIDSERSVTDSRWVLAQMNALLDESDDQVRSELKKELADWIGRSTDLPQLFSILPALPAGWCDDSVILNQLAKAADLQECLHERESLLRAILTRGTDEQRLTAAAQLLSLAEKHKDLPTTRRLLQFLESAPAGSMVRTGASETPVPPAQLARQYRDRKDVADLLHSDIDWPEEIRVAEHSQAQTRTAVNQLPLLGPPSPALEGWGFFLDGSGANIEVYDQNGERRGRIPTSYGGARYAAEIELGRYVTMHNHLAMVVLQDRMIVLDCLTDPSSPRVLYMRELARRDENPLVSRGMIVRSPRLGIRSILLELQSGRINGNVGPLTDSVLCYGAEDSLVALNPTTGEELWRRRDFPPGAEIMGDRDYVIVKPIDSFTLRIYRALDGELIKETEVPLGTLDCMVRRYGDWGRGIPVVRDDESRFRFELFDPVNEEPIWEFTGPAGTRWTVVGGQKIALLTPDLRMSIRDGLTGEEIFAAALPDDFSSGKLSVMEYVDQWIALTSEAQSEFADEYAPRSHRLMMSRVHGPVAALDRTTGELRWTRKVYQMDAVMQGPTRWPLLIFASVQGTGDALIINRRNGDVIRQKNDGFDGFGQINWMTETQPYRVHLRIAKTRMTLLFGVGDRDSQESSPATLPEQKEGQPSVD